jgi:hypothetical protein
LTGQRESAIASEFALRIGDRELYRMLGTVEIQRWPGFSLPRHAEIQFKGSFDHE